MQGTKEHTRHNGCTHYTHDPHNIIDWKKTISITDTSSYLCWVNWEEMYSISATPKCLISFFEVSLQARHGFVVLELRGSRPAGSTTFTLRGKYNLYFPVQHRPPETPLRVAVEESDGVAKLQAGLLHLNSNVIYTIAYSRDLQYVMFTCQLHSSMEHGMPLKALFSLYQMHTTNHMENEYSLSSLQLNIRHWCCYLTSSASHHFSD